MATTAQIQQALQAAQAAGNAQDVAVLQQALGQAQGTAQATTGPTRDQLSQAFYAAKQAGNEDDARQIIGYVQQHGMTIAPPSAAQTNAGVQKLNAANVAAMPWYEKAWTGVGEGASNFYGGIKQHIVDPVLDVVAPRAQNRVQDDQHQVAENRRLAEALNNTTAGKVGNVAGSIASSAPLLLIPGGGESALARTGVAALTGAGFGYIAPSASEGEHVSNTLLGAATGPLVTGGGKAAQLLGRGGKSILQRYVAPDAVASSRIGRILAGDGVTPGQLRAYNDPVSGVQPTLAQVLQTPKAVQLERAARNNPISGPDIAAQDLQNNTARASALQQHVLTQTDLTAARGTRATNFAPTADALKNAGSVDVGPLRFEAANLAQRGNNAMTRAAAKKVLSFIEDNTAQAGQNAGMIPVSDLHTLQHDLGTIVMQANPEAINTAQALRELQPFKSAIVGTVDSLVPGYQNALRQYASDSAPINTSRTIGDLLNPTRATATDLTGEPTITAARLKSVLSKDDRAPFKMTPQARQDLENVQASLQSRNAAQRSIGPMGSPTEENRLNQPLNASARHAGATAGAVTGSYVAPGAGTIAGLLLGHGADMLDRAAQNRIASAVGRRLMDPKAAADSLTAYLDLQARRQAFNNRIVPTYLGRNWLGYGSGLLPNVISTNRAPPEVTP